MGNTYKKHWANYAFFFRDRLDFRAPREARTNMKRRVECKGPPRPHPSFQMNGRQKAPEFGVAISG